MLLELCSLWVDAQFSWGFSLGLGELVWTYSDACEEKSCH